MDFTIIDAREDTTVEVQHAVQCKVYYYGEIIGILLDKRSPDGDYLFTSFSGVLFYLKKDEKLTTCNAEVFVRLT